MAMEADLPFVEVWRDIKGYEGRYQVSSEGRVKTVERFKSDGRHQREGIRISEIDQKGYEFVLLFDGIGYHRFSVHVLVAKAFIPNIYNKPQVNHIDGNKLNNKVDNLEWCTASENQLHALRMGLARPRRGESHSSAKLSDADVIQIRDLRKRGYKLRELAERFGVCETHISRIVRNIERVMVNY